jgi:hypothetical protein
MSKSAAENHSTGLSEVHRRPPAPGRLRDVVHHLALGLVQGTDVVLGGMTQCAEGLRLISHSARAAAALLGVSGEPSSRPRARRARPAPRAEVAFSELDRAAARAALRDLGHIPGGRRS